MKAIFDTKEFTELESDEKLKILELAEKAFGSRDFENEIFELDKEKQQCQNAIMISKEKISELQSSVTESEALAARKSQVLSELDELKKQAGLFKQKSVDLDKHKSALELKSAVLKKHSLETEIEDIKNELENLREQKIDGQNSLVEIKANFDGFYDGYNEEMARLLSQKQILFKNASDESKSEDKILENFKSQQTLSEVRDAILVAKENIEKHTMKCQAVESEIAEKLDQIGSVSISEESKELIVQAKDLESEIIIYDGMLSKLDVLLDSTKADLADAKVLYSQELGIERKRDLELEKIDNSTAKVFENTELSNFEKLRNCDKSLADIYVVEYEVGLVNKRIETLKADIAARNKRVDDYQSKIQETSQALEQKEKVVHECKDILKERQDDRESLLGNNYLSMLVEYTNIGDKCPVCKSKVLEKNYTPKTDLAGANKEIEMARNRIAYAEKDRDAALVVLAGLKAKVEFELSQIEFENQEIQTLESSKIKIYQRVVDVNDQMIDNFGNIKNALQKTAGALEELINLQYDLKESVQSNISKKTEYGSRISLLSEKYEQLLDLYYALQKERAERELLLLEAKSSSEDNDFEQKRLNFAENQSLIQVETNNIIDLYMQISELKTAIMVETEKLSELEYQRGKLESVSNTFSSEEINVGLSIDEIDEKMRSLKESYKHLLSLKNDAENSVQNTLKEYDIKTKILSYKIDELQDVSALVSSLVFRYGFADENDARNYITTDNMIKLKEGELKSYQNRLTKLEAEYSLLSESNIAENDVMSEIVRFEKEIEINVTRLGELNILMDSVNNEKQEFETIQKMIKKLK